jgi:uncharacterized membrane protein
MKEKWIMFEIEYLKRYSYFQTDTMLLTISILFALVFYLFAYIQNSFLLEALILIVFIPLIVFLVFETYKDGMNLVNFLNEKMKELGGNISK